MNSIQTNKQSKFKNKKKTIKINVSQNNSSQLNQIEFSKNCSYTFLQMHFRATMQTQNPSNGLGKKTLKTIKT